MAFKPSMCLGLGDLEGKFWSPQFRSMSREIALGTDDGRIFSLVCDEKDKKEKVGQGWLVSEENKEKIIGIHQIPLKKERTLLLVSTACRLSVFTGPQSIEALGAGYKGAHGAFLFLYTFKSLHSSLCLD